MISLEHISKSYKTGEFVQRALDDVSVSFRDNEFVAILGPSGSGKTTLLNILGGLDSADSGQIVIDGVPTARYRDADWDAYRNHHIGFVFQSYNLIPHQSILSNVELALTLAGRPAKERKDRARAALERVGLKEHAAKKPNQLSGGQMQRVAIARALVNEPDVVLADEPTGALDTETGLAVMELLKEIAQERLVVMVTHNPELAERYANRIVRIADGQIVADSNPLSTTDAAQLDVTAGTPQHARYVSHKQGAWQSSDETRAATATTHKERASMSFLTALGLSFNNLMTKKGRTFMTAFAGSIGIIGIAAILALSNGVNNYIARTEEDAMASYPLSVSESATDFSSMFLSAATNREEQVSDERSPSSTSLIPETTLVSDMFAHISNNDLSSFKDYIEDEQVGLAEHVNAVMYDYGVVPRFYKADDTKIVEVGSATGAPRAGSASAMASFGLSFGSSSAFQEMLDNQALLDTQYDMLIGHWPKEYDECVLVLNMSGSISDYTLYGLGVLDPEEFLRTFESVTADNDIIVPNTKVDLSYGDALGLSFKAIDPASVWRFNDETSTWTDMSNDTAFMRQALGAGIELKVVGVIRPAETTDTPSLGEGIAYTHALTERIMERARTSQIVQEQLAHREVDVFTGERFEDLRAGTAEAFDMDRIFSVDQEALERAFSFDTSALSAFGQGMDLSGLNFDSSSFSINPQALSLDGSAMGNIFSNEALTKIMQGAPEPQFDNFELELTEEQQRDLSALMVQLGGGFLPYWYEQHPGESISEETDFSEDLSAYLALEQNAALIEQAQQLVGPELETQVQAAFESYLTTQFGPYLQKAMTELAQQAAQVMAAQLASSLQKEMARATEELGNQLSSQLSGVMQQQMSQLSSAMEGAFSVDADAFANAIHFNMDAEDLASLMNSYAQAERMSYDNNLSLLGYADPAKPRSISFYPKSFEDKEDVLNIIDAYNRSMKDAGDEDKVISYTDIMGTLLRSVSDIVNTISTVLIAFVSISLIVSSIMIGIITYISVLERRKEIGILRAMGASKRNIASVFNAETIIEGLIAGVLAIAVVMAVSVPVNAFVYSWRQVPNIMQLSPQQAASLIAISVILTLIAGLIPSSAAARRDPVEALRSE